MARDARPDTRVLARRRRQPVRHRGDAGSGRRGTTGSQLPEQFKVFDNPWIIGAAGGALCDRVCRRQGAVGRFDLGLGAHADSSGRRRADRGGVARRGIAGADRR